MFGVPSGFILLFIKFASRPTQGFQDVRQDVDGWEEAKTSTFTGTPSRSVVIDSFCLQRVGGRSSPFGFDLFLVSLHALIVY